MTTCGFVKLVNSADSLRALIAGLQDHIVIEVPKCPAACTESERPFTLCCLYLKEPYVENNLAIAS